MKKAISVVLGGLVAFAALAGVPASARAAAPQASGNVAQADQKAWWSAPVTTVEGISEYRLPNGLRVLLFPDQSSANVTVNITYFVGSRHEGLGEKGMAHLVEHMIFKGTPTFPNPWESLQKYGAQFNGTTWTDRTNYFETLVATDENLNFALQLEADRMVNSFIAQDALEKEMTVVRNEFEIGENNPFQVLYKELFAKAYTWHPYRDSTIGNRSDIERVPADNLRRFYKHFYRPSNAMLVVAGKFEPKRALELIDKYFAPLTNPETPIGGTWTEEPVQDGPRHVEIRREGSQASVGAFYHLPAGTHPDSVAAELLADILSNRPSGRLYKALVEGNLAASVSASAIGMAERGQMVIIATLKEGQDPAAALNKIKEVMESFAQNPVTDAEVERARSGALSQVRLLMTDSNRVGVALTEAASIGDWRMLFINRDRLREKTTAQVQTVATTYFVENNRTTGKFIPTKNPVRAQIPAAPDIRSMVESYKGSETMSAGEAFEPTPANIESRVQRTNLSDNIELATLQKQTRGEAVNATFIIRFGDEAAFTGKRVATDMLAPMLRRGTTSRSFQQISDELDNLQSQVNLSSSPTSIRVSITSERKNFSKTLALVTDMLRNPAFSESEFATLQKERIAGIERGKSDPQALAANALQRAMSPFDKSSIHYVPTIEESLEEVRAATLQDVKSLYESVVGPSNVQIAIVGQFDQAETDASLKAMFDGWTAKKPFTRIARPFKPNTSGPMSINTPDKPMAFVGMGAMLEMSQKDSDFPAMQIAGYILGGGSKNRMLDRLRQKDGLSYGAGAQVQPSPLDNLTPVIAFALCAKQNASKAASAMKEEMTRWINEGVDAEELDAAKKAFRLAFLTRLNDDGAVAGSLAEGLFLDRTMKWDEERLAKIDALTEAQVDDVVKRRVSGANFFELQAGDLSGAAATSN